MGKLSDYEQGYTDANKFNARVSLRHWAIEQSGVNLRNGGNTVYASDVIPEAEKLIKFISANSSQSSKAPRKRQ